MRTLIFEPRSVGTGHYFQYASIVLSGLVDIGLKPELLCSSHAPDDESFHAHLNASLLSSCKVHPIIDAQYSKLDSFNSTKMTLRTLAQTVRSNNFDWIYIPTGDGILQTIGMFNLVGKSPVKGVSGFEGLLLNGRSGYGDFSMQKCKALASRKIALAAGCTRFHFVDPYYLKRSGKQSLHLNIMPEPVERLDERTCEQARVVFDISGEEKVVALVGSQDFRKGIDLFANALAADDTLSDFTLLVAGKLDLFAEQKLDQIRKLEKRSIRIVLLNRYISDETLTNAIHAANLVVLPYRTPYQSSGILLRCALAGTRVITSNLGYLGNFTVENNAGHTVDIYDPVKFSAELKLALRHNNSLVASDPLARFHSVENAQSHWTYGIRCVLSNQKPEPPFTLQ